MKDLGFTRLNSDVRIFVCCDGTGLTIAVVYVDDAMFLARIKNLSRRRKLSSWLNGNAKISEMLRSFCACTLHALDQIGRAHV